MVTAGAALAAADMVFPLFEGNKKGAAAPGAGSRTDE
jgi:hypothetical protein